MKVKIAVLILLGCAGVIRADQVVAEVQQALKDEGFYYGEINGEKNADTTAAIRRYQIRNGLQITGELDNDTLRALRSVPSTTSPPAVTNAPSPSPIPPSSPAESLPDTAANTPAPSQAFEPPPSEDRSAEGRIGRGEQLYPPNPPTVPTQPGGLFADTPYETAPPKIQHDIVASAQRALSDDGFYRGDIDGVFGPALEFSLRAYQSRTRLPVTGRLDLDTLAALELLPGARAPVYRPRRRIPPPVRGEWIRP
jgi:peptidoglycan hydrolase-like protein with peptidoglycan-binding domain